MRRIVVVLITLLMIASLGSVAGPVAAQAGSTLSLEDQRTTGHEVYLSEIVIAHGGWLDIRNEACEVLWTARGNPDLPYLEPGEAYSGWASISPALTENQTLTAVLINDTNQNRAYDDGIDETILRGEVWMTVQILSDFDRGTEGWTFVSTTRADASEFYRNPKQPEYRAAEVGDGGYIAASDSLDGVYSDGTNRRDIRMWLAPDIYLGDRANFYGGTFRFDARGSVDWQSCVAGTRLEERPTLWYWVTFYSGDRELRFQFLNREYPEFDSFSAAYSAAPGAEWTTYSIPISAPVDQTERAQGIENGRWLYYEVRDGQRGGYQDELTEETFREVFGNLDRIEVQGESVAALRGTDCEEPADGEEGHLDNVVWNVAPPEDEPAATPAVEITPTADAEGVDADSASDGASDADGDSPPPVSDSEAGGEDGSESTEADSPGFTAALAVLALTGIALLAARRAR